MSPVQPYHSEGVLYVSDALVTASPHSETPSDVRTSVPTIRSVLVIRTQQRDATQHATQCNAIATSLYVSAVNKQPVKVSLETQEHSSNSQQPTPPHNNSYSSPVPLSPNKILLDPSPSPLPSKINVHHQTNNITQRLNPPRST